jgi:O-antigen/teichoic acid export membrane protein
MPLQIRVLTHFLTKEEYGSLTLVIITVSFLAIVSSFGHFEFLVRRLPGRPEEYQRGVLGLVWRWFGTMAAVLAVLLVAVVLVVRPAKVAIGAPGVVIAGLYLFVLVFVMQRIFFMLSRTEWARVRTLQLMHSDTWFIPILAVTAFTTLTLNRVLAVWFLWLVAAAVLAYRWAGPAARGASPVRIGEVFAFGAPLLPLMLGEWMFRLVDRYVLVSLRGAEAVANYTLCLNIALIVYTVGASVLDLFVPEFNKARNQIPGGDLKTLAAAPPLRSLFTTMLRYCLVLALTGGLFIAIAGRQLLKLLSGDKYQDAAHIVPFLTLVPLFFLLWVVFNRILLAMDKTRVIGGVTLVVGVANIGLNLVLVPRLGEIGCALAITTSLGILAVFTGLYVRSWLWVVWPRLKPARLLGMTILNGLGISLARAFLGSHALVCLVAAALWCVVWIFALGLVGRDDWSALAVMPLKEIEEDLPHEDLVS